MGPELLIADEAVSALDVSVQAQVLALLEEIREQLDLAMLFITRPSCCGTNLPPGSGDVEREIVEYGQTVDVFENPQHDYTKALFEAAPGRHFRFAGT